jgi:hypothetical protein
MDNDRYTRCGLTHRHRVTLQEFFSFFFFSSFKTVPSQETENVRNKQMMNQPSVCLTQPVVNNQVTAFRP